MTAPERIGFDYDRDIPRLQRFLARMRQTVAQSAYFQLGDLLWRIHCPTNGFTAQTDLPIWQDAGGNIVAFGFYLRSQDNPEFFLDPRYYREPLADEIIAWARDVAHRHNRVRMETSCVRWDRAKAAFLTSHGFEGIGEPMAFMARSLSDPISGVEVDPRYEIAPLRPNVPTLAVTGNRPFPRPAYERMRAAVGYRSDLDVKALAGETIVAGCICWLDEVDGCGELEPVGTHPDHRRQGLAAACIARALRALRDHGAAMAYVRPDCANAPAVALYEKMGFRTVDLDIGWELTL